MNQGSTDQSRLIYGSGQAPQKFRRFIRSYQRQLVSENLGSAQNAWSEDQSARGWPSGTSFQVKSFNIYQRSAELSYEEFSRKRNGYEFFPIQDSQSPCLFRAVHASVNVYVTK